MRVLIAASGGEGHLGPLLTFAEALGALGGEPLLVVPPQLAATVRERGLPIAVTGAPDPVAVRGIHAAAALASRSERSHLIEVELFGLLHTEAAMDTMERALRSFEPHLVLREPCDYASAVVAARAGVPMAQVAISPGAADEHGLRLASSVIEPLQPGVTAAVAASPFLTRFPVVDRSFPDTRPYRTPPPRRERTASPPLLWVTLGTMAAPYQVAGPTWTAIFDAVSRLPVRVVASSGRGTALPPSPANTRVVHWVPAEDILASADLVICHGGSGTVLAALAAGVPLVVVPLFADQLANAATVDRLGAGVVVRPDPGPGVQGLTGQDVPRLRAAVETVLADARFAAAARRSADDLASRPTPGESLVRIADELGTALGS